jgi:hypothetical protein
MVDGVNLTGRRAFAVAGAAVVVAAGTGTAVAVALPSQSQTASVPADGRSSATLDVVTGTHLLTLRVANLGGTSGTLLQASTPGGEPVPQLRAVQGAGPLRSGSDDLILLSESHGAAAVTVTLNAAVSWRLDFAAGTQRTTADLRGGRVAGISITAGSQVVDLTLPRPGGTVPIQLTAGVSQLLMSLPAGVPVRVTAAGGAGEVSLDGATHVGVAGGSVFTAGGWAAGTAGFDVDATAGAARVIVSQ